MRKVISSKLVVVAILSLVAVALCSAGPLAPVSGRGGASVTPWDPPDPWDVRASAR